MEHQKILIVEDETKVASFIKKGLEEQAFDVRIAYDGMTGKRLARSEFFDLIIIDINIPVINGYELCRAIRAFNMQVPILMLTALGSTENKLEGFEAGGDDYLVKPFEFLELLARIRALLKRISNQPSQQYLRPRERERPSHSRGRHAPLHPLERSHHYRSPPLPRNYKRDAGSRAREFDIRAARTRWAPQPRDGHPDNERDQVFHPAYIRALNKLAVLAGKKHGV